MSIIRVRRIDAEYDVVFGRGQADYLTDLDAIVQIIKSRLLLFTGEWWADKEAGLPLWQSILGMAGANGKKKVVDGFIQKRILETPHVTGIETISSTYNADTREYSFSATINTQFGTVAISNNQ